MSRFSITNKLSITKINVVGNLLGRGYVALMSFLFVPLYVSLLGPESYGLIGLYASLQVVVSLLDMGLSPTLTRELARLSTRPEDAQEARDLVRTLEVVYWLIGMTIGTGVFFLAPWLAGHLVHAQTLSVSTIVTAVRIGGLIMVFQWPDSFYSGGLMGLQQQVALNYIRMGTATLQGVGALLILRFISCTIEAYFCWMVVVWAIQTVMLVYCLWKKLSPSSQRPRFRKELWGKNARFTAGMMGITLTSIILTQLDKMILVTYLPLEKFGYYILAFNIANCLTFIIMPIYGAVFPRFTQLASLRDTQGLKRFYHRSCQLVSVIIIPLTVLGVLFSNDLLRAYLHNPQTAANARPLFCLLLIGTACNSLVSLPYGLQLAYGWTQLSISKNVIAVLLFVPLMLVMVKHFGAAGAGIMWIAVNAGYIALEIPFMHCRLLRGEAAAWYIKDIGLPLLVSLIVGLLARAVMPAGVPSLLVVIWSALMCVVAIACAMYCMPWMRAMLRRVLHFTQRQAA